MVELFLTLDLKYLQNLLIENRAIEAAYYGFIFYIVNFIYLYLTRKSTKLITYNYYVKLHEYFQHILLAFYEFQNPFKLKLPMYLI
jgi:hypothetical protein